jgi:carboxypeptidase family protein
MYGWRPKIAIHSSCSYGMPPSPLPIVSPPGDLRRKVGPNFEALEGTTMSHTKLNLILGLLAFVASFAGTQAWAQTATGRVVGNVSDSQGALVAAAKVVVTDADTGVAETTTNKDSYFEVPNLPIGNYMVTVSHTGFNTATTEARATVQRISILQDAPVESLPGPTALGIKIVPDLSSGPPAINFDSGLDIGIQPEWSNHLPGYHL